MGVDPGKTTGICVAERVAVANPGHPFEVLYTAEIMWETRIHELRELFQVYNDIEAIVVESFRLYPHAAQSQIGSDFPSVRVIGTIETVLEISDIAAPIVFLPASIHKRVLIPEWLPHYSSAHVRDAYALVKYYYLTKLKKEGKLL